MANGEAVTLAIAGNAVDIGCSEAVSLILAFRKGVPLTLVAPGSLHTGKAPVGYLFARNDLKATTGADFNNKRSPSSDLMVSRNMERNCGSTKTAETRKPSNSFSSRGPKSASPCKTAGRRCIRSGAIVSICEEDGAPGGEFDVGDRSPIFHERALRVGAVCQRARRRRSKVPRRARAAATWANANPDQTALILERIARVTPEMLQAANRAQGRRPSIRRCYNR